VETGGVKAKNQAEFEILGETDDFLAVDKPAGLLVHPTKPGGPRTLWDELRCLLGYELAVGGQVSLINRLDRETSGVLLVAKNSWAAREAGIALQRGRLRKEYVALVFGWPPWSEKTIDGPIVRRGEVARSEVWLERMVASQGAAAVTRVRVEERLSLSTERHFSVVRAWPESGRTHQIRVHLAHVGFPVVGDKIYARGSGYYLQFIERGWTHEMEAALWLPRHALHSARLALEVGNQKLEWSSPLPDDLMEFAVHGASAGGRLVY
jgi:23S rRNA pseudouridine1911/1915/1917 synthase